MSIAMQIPEGDAVWRRNGGRCERLARELVIGPLGWCMFGGGDGGCGDVQSDPE
jgi:hypothetical protein